MCLLGLEPASGFMNSSCLLWNFFSSVLPLLGRMDSADEAWLSLLLVALFGLLLFLRIKYPDASKGAETAVLVGATILLILPRGSLDTVKASALKIL